MGIRFDRLSLLSGAIGKDRNVSMDYDARAPLKAMLNQPRHVVYHSHYAGIFNSHRANDADRANAFVGSDAVWCGYQCTVLHRAGGMLAIQ